MVKYEKKVKEAALLRSFILGTDWWSDCDDAVALRVLTRAVKDGKVKLLGVGINACMEYSAPSLRAFLDLDGIKGVPIGIDHNARDYVGLHNAKYQKRLAMEVPSLSNDDFPDAVKLYRQILASQTEKVEIIEIGFLGVLRDLLKSPADSISDMSGIELVKNRVSRIWSMAGKWDADGECEHNFSNNAYACLASHEFLELSPVPVTFLGFEVGLNVITGGRVDKNDHLYRVLSDYGAEGGRHSWDPMLVLLAITEDVCEAGYSEVRGYASVDPETGANYFSPVESGPHSYVVKSHENKYYEDLINSIL